MKCVIFVAELVFCFKYGLSWPIHYAHRLWAAILPQNAFIITPNGATATRFVKKRCFCKKMRNVTVIKIHTRRPRDLSPDACLFKNSLFLQGFLLFRPFLGFRWVLKKDFQKKKKAASGIPDFKSEIPLISRSLHPTPHPIFSRVYPYPPFL